MIPPAYLVLWFLATFLLLWGASLLFRGVAQRWSRERRCPACRVRMRAADGLTCPACNAQAECVEALSTGAVRWPFILTGAGVMLVSIGVFHVGYVVRAWSAGVGDVYDAPTGAAALGIAAFGLIVCAMGIRGERAKGRRRCPKCWYDMAGGATTCPECGFAAKAARDFYRPRRRWRSAAIGLAILLAAYPIYITPRVRAGGWVAAIPTWVLIVGLPWWPDSAMSDYNSPYSADFSLSGRWGEEGGMWNWERAFLRWRARSTITPHSNLKSIVRAGVFFIGERDDQVSSNIVLSIAEAVVRGAPEDIQSLGDVMPGTMSILVPDGSYSGLDPYVPALISQLDFRTPSGLDWTYWLLARAGPSADVALPHFVEMLRSAPGTRDFEAIDILQSRLACSPATRAAVIGALANPDASIRRGAALVLAADDQGEEQVCEALLPLLEDPDDEVAAAAGGTLANIGIRADDVFPAMLRQVHSDRRNRARFVPHLLLYDDDSVKRYLPLLLELLSDPSAEIAEAALYAIQHTAFGPADLTTALESLQKAKFDGDAETVRLELIDSIKSDAADSQGGSEPDNAGGPQ